MKKAMIYIHGKGGNHLEAEQYKKNCLGFDIIGIDYNDYFPWIVQNQIKSVYDKVHERYDHIYVLANSIGAYFAMHTLQNCDIDKALFISPVLGQMYQKKICARRAKYLRISGKYYRGNIYALLGRTQ